MRLIDADELLEHVGRDKLDSRELIIQMINNAPTVTKEDIAKEVEKNLLNALDYQKKLYEQVLGRLDAYSDIVSTVIKTLVDRAARN